MASVFVQADDFSGAAEVGSCFVQHGHIVQVLLGTSDAETASPRHAADVVVTDTHSRGLSPSAAGKAAAAAFSSHAAAEAGILFKKIDSIWRGNISAELRALNQLGYSVVIAGALPQLQRTVRQGQAFVGGVPLDHTDLWQAEHVSPPSSIAELIRPESPESVKPMNLRQVRNADLHAALSEALDTDSPAVVLCDGETAADLELVVDALIRTEFRGRGRRIVLAGTGGAAEVLAQRLVTTPARNAQFTPAPDSERGEPHQAPLPVLAVVGSASGTAQAQLTELEAEGYRVIRLDPDHKGPHRTELEAAKAALATSTNVAVSLQQTGVDPGKAAVIVKSLARFTAEAANGIRTDFILTGGETAREVLEAVGIQSMVPLAAVQHGAVLSRTDQGTLVGTKPGSFGDRYALSQLHHQIQHRRGQPLGLPAASSDPTAFNQPGATMTSPTVAPSEQNSLPVVAVTMGDGAGVGPEVVVAAALDRQSNAECRPVVIGDALRLRQAADILGVDADIQAIGNVEDAVFTPGRVNVIDLALLPEDLPWGQLSAVAGHAAYEYIRVASELAMAGRVQAICTAPLNKEALHAAGHIFPGHTELLAQLTGTEEVSMMLSTPKIRVIHVTTHIGLADAIRKIEPGLVERTIRRGHEALVRAGVPEPKIGVCAINPHAGENGLFGQGEEAEKIEPGVKAAQADGINAVGPLPADTLFFLAGRGDYDLVVAMYHDQGHGPVKVLGIEAGVNITVGLPVIRTSVDHGTAFDIAGKAIADSRSMVEALHQAAEMATRPSMAV